MTAFNMTIHLKQWSDWYVSAYTNIEYKKINTRFYTHFVMFIFKSKRRKGMKLIK